MPMFLKPCISHLVLEAGMLITIEGGFTPCRIEAVKVSHEPGKFEPHLTGTAIVGGEALILN